MPGTWLSLYRISWVYHVVLRLHVTACGKMLYRDLSSKSQTEGGAPIDTPVRLGAGVCLSCQGAHTGRAGRRGQNLACRFSAGKELVGKTGGGGNWAFQVRVQRRKGRAARGAGGLGVWPVRRAGL